MARKAHKSGESKKKVGEDWSFITEVVKDIEGKFGAGSALIPNSGTMLCKVEHWVSTRNFLIDSALAGGLPMPRPIIPFGRLTEVAGLNATGKTTLLGQIIAETQATDGIAAIIDTEQALDLAYFEKLGVDLSRLIVVQADTAEEVFSKMEFLISKVKEHGIDRLMTICWDSLGGTPTKAQIESESDASFYAEAAKVIGKNLQRTVAMISKKKVALIFANHLYRKMGVQYGDPFETYGGEKVKFYATLRIRLARVGMIKEKVADGDDSVIGHRVKVKVLKNKMAPILRSVDVPCLGGHGFSLDYSIMEQGIKQGLLTGATWRTWKTSKGEAVKFLGWRGFLNKVVKHTDYPNLIAKVVTNYHQKATVE